MLRYTDIVELLPEDLSFFQGQAPLPRPWQLLVLFFIFDKVEVFHQKPHNEVQVENSVAQHATTRLHDEHLREASQHSPRAT